MKNVLVVGSINMDMTIIADRFPNPGETVTGNSFCTHFGGKGANQAVALSKQGTNVKFIGAVGKDANGKACIENLEKNGVLFCGKELIDTTTGVAVITVCRGENCIILHSGANSCVDSHQIMENEALFKWADAVVMQLEIPVETVLTCSRIAKQNGCVTVLNPAPAKLLPQAIYEYTDLLIPNEHEARILTGIDCASQEDIRQAIFKLKEKGVGEVIITLGEKGCAYSIEKNVYFKNSYPSKAVDTTAAGDSFIGGLCSALEKTSDPAEAVDYASKVSSITVGRMGACDSIPKKQEVISFFSKIR